MESTSELEKFSKVPWYEIFRFQGKDYKPQSGEKVAVIWLGSKKEERDKLGLLSLKKTLSWEEAIGLLPLVQPPEAMVGQAGHHYIRNVVVFPRGVFQEAGETKGVELIDQVLKPLGELAQNYPLFKTRPLSGEMGLDFTSYDGKQNLGRSFVFCPFNWKEEELTHLNEFFKKRLAVERETIKRIVGERAKELHSSLVLKVGDVLALEEDKKLQKRMGEDWPQILRAFDRLEKIMANLKKAGQGDFSVVSHPFGWPQMIVLEERG